MTQLRHNPIRELASKINSSRELAKRKLLRPFSRVVPDTHEGANRRSLPSFQLFSERGRQLLRLLQLRLQLRELRRRHRGLGQLLRAGPDLAESLGIDGRVLKVLLEVLSHTHVVGLAIHSGRQLVPKKELLWHQLTTI